MPEPEKNKACWNCWYDEFCSWHPAGAEDACENFMSENAEGAPKKEKYILKIDTHHYHESVRPDAFKKMLAGGQ